jgi:ADP-ribose pyrophosphatase YjhB (NUDIX family)
MNPYINKFEICIRAVILNKGKILVCQRKKKGYFFFPGGHLEFGEKMGDALAREIKEELGVKVKKFSLIGIIDNVFTEDNEKHHEINMVFETKLDKYNVISKEDHIDFYWKTMDEFKKEKILPIVLKKELISWFKTKKMFWASGGD